MHKYFNIPEKEAKQAIFEMIKRHPNILKDDLRYFFPPDILDKYLGELLEEQKIMEGKVTRYIVNPLTDVTEYLEKKE